MTTSLAAAAKAKNIEYFLISFVDLLGHLRAKLVPAAAIGEMDGGRICGLRCLARHDAGPPGPVRNSRPG